MTASRVPATVRLRRLFSRCSQLGLRMYSPSTSATLTAPVGPANGALLMDSAIDEPFMATTSGAMSCSTDRTVAITCTSL